MLARSDILSQKLHRFPLPGSRRLVHYYLESGILLPDLFRWEKMGPGGENGGLEHRVTCPVEADELASDSPVNHAGVDPRSRWGGVDSEDLQLSPGACGLEDRSSHPDGRHRRELRTRDGALREQQGIVGEI